MEREITHKTESRDPGKMFLPSLVLSRFALQPPLLIASLLLVDMARTYNQPVAIMGQIRTIAALIAAISAILVSLWGLRFRPKSILLFGLIISSISAIGAFFAINFTILLIAYALSGLGFALTDPNVYTLVGKHFPLKHRPVAIAWILSGAALAGIIGTPFIGIIIRVGIGGWRMAFLGFALPISLLSVIIVIKAIPRSPTSINQEKSAYKRQYKEGIKQIFSTKSPIACIGGTIFSYAAWQAVLLYSVSFLRERYHISLKFSTIVVIGISIGFIFGSQVGGRLVNQFGRKRIVIVSVFFVGILIIIFTNLKMSLWLVIILIFLDACFDGVRATAGNSLSLEQVPNYRGSMMALNSAAWNIGNAIGAGVGGLALYYFNYEGLGIILGAMGFVAALIYYVLVNEPT